MTDMATATFALQRYKRLRRAQTLLSLRATRLGPARFVCLLAMTSCIVLASCDGGGSSGKCGTPTANHCYAVEQWNGNPSLLGGGVGITPVQLNVGSAYHITNELWVAGGSGSNSSWIEVGEINRNGQPPAYFWGDRRPGYDYAEHIIGAVPASDLNDPTYRPYFQISPDPDHANTYFVATYGTKPLDNLYAGRSTDNRMVANKFSVGEELAGTTTGVSAKPAVFGDIAILVAWGNEYWATKGGRTLSQNPPTGKWTDGPAYPSDSGFFKTSCC
jgi:hypothetical protein